MITARSVLIALAWLPTFLLAQEKMNVEEAMDYVAGEICQCAAYFTVVSMSVDGMETEQARMIASQSTMAAEAAMNAATVFIDSEIAFARVRTSMNNMMEQIDNDASRIGLLTAEYGHQCRALLDDIPGRIIELTR